MSSSHSFLLISLLSFGLSGISSSLKRPKGALASAISVVHEQSSASLLSIEVISTSGAVVEMMVTLGVVSVDESKLTDDISLLSVSFFLMFKPAVLGRILACIGFAAVPTLGVTDVANPLIIFKLGPLNPSDGCPSPPGGGPMPPGGGPLPSDGGLLPSNGGPLPLDGGSLPPGGGPLPPDGGPLPPGGDSLFAGGGPLLGLLL